MFKSKLEGFSILDKPSPRWDVGFVFRDAPGFGNGCVLQENFRLTIRPGETGAQAYQREMNVKMPTDTVVAIVTE